jgi:hypothetical protein
MLTMAEFVAAAENEGRKILAERGFTGTIRSEVYPSGAIVVTVYEGDWAMDAVTMSPVGHATLRQIGA